ncbi:MAG: nucleotidyltransferase [Tepidisphaerales bacterium]
MGKANLFPDFRDLLKSLNSAGVRYLVIGGYAVIYYGYHRATDDIDLWIAIDPENTEKVSRALIEFGGFADATVKPSMFQTRGKVFIFGKEPSRVDILTSPSAVNFEESYARRHVADFDGIKVPLISFADLKKNKLASGRNKDLADVENLPPTWPWPEESKGKRRKQP